MIRCFYLDLFWKSESLLPRVKNPVSFRTICLKQGDTVYYMPLVNSFSPLITLFPTKNSLNKLKKKIEASIQ